MIITFGRQHGTRGYLIAQQLAAQLGCNYCDKEILERAAENSHFSREILRSYDEKRVFPYFLPAAGSLEMGGDFRLNMRLANAEFDAIRELAEEGDAVFIGRCADYVLRERPDLVRVFITAERDFRIRTVVEHSELTPEQAAHHPNRNLITRAVGVEPTVEADVFSLRLRRGDRLLLCSDGLSGTLSEETLCALSRQSRDAAAICRSLVDRAVELGARDNVTAAVAVI